MKSKVNIPIPNLSEQLSPIKKITNLFFFNLSQSQNKEITVLRSKLCENESDLERMKRSITNERFEREKCAQELRKIHENSINDSSSRYNSRCHSPIRSCQNPPITMPLPLTCHNSGGAAAAVAAARAAADSSIHATYAFEHIL